VDPDRRADRSRKRGGPLLNSRGEVIGFALSATDLLSVLRSFYPAKIPIMQTLSGPGE